MANEINFAYQAGKTLEAAIYANGWTQQGANIALTETGIGSGLYVGSVPGVPAIANGVYQVLFIDTIGPPVNDVVGRGPLYWASNVEDREAVQSVLDTVLADTAAMEPLVTANLDATVSSRATPADIAASEATILAAIAALNNLSQADVQAALTAQGYTTARAALLDFLDAAITSRAAPGAAMDLVGPAFLTIQASILSDGIPFDGADIAAILASNTALQEFIEGGRDIDFAGNDALGWQRIERNVAGTLLRRYNLFDENGVRINETVASFIGRAGMISSEVAI